MSRSARAIEFSKYTRIFGDILVRTWQLIGIWLVAVTAIFLATGIYGIRFAGFFIYFMAFAPVLFLAITEERIYKYLPLRSRSLRFFCWVFGSVFAVSTTVIIGALALSLGNAVPDNASPTQFFFVRLPLAAFATYYIVLLYQELSSMIRDTKMWRVFSRAIAMTLMRLFRNEIAVGSISQLPLIITLFIIFFSHGTWLLATLNNVVLSNWWALSSLIFCPLSLVLLPRLKWGILSEFALVAGEHYKSRSKAPAPVFTTHPGTRCQVWDVLWWKQATFICVMFVVLLAVVIIGPPGDPMNPTSTDPIDTDPQLLPILLMTFFATLVTVFLSASLPVPMRVLRHLPISTRRIKVWIASAPLLCAAATIVPFLVSATISSYAFPVQLPAVFTAIFGMCLWQSSIILNLRGVGVAAILAVVILITSLPAIGFTWTIPYSWVYFAVAGLFLSISGYAALHETIAHSNAPYRNRRDLEM